MEKGHQAGLWCTKGYRWIGADLVLRFHNSQSLNPLEVFCIMGKDREIIELMKPILFSSFFFFIPFLSTGQQVDSIKVFYLPWKFNIEGEITEGLVRDYPGHSDSVIITNQTEITDFLLALTLVNLRPQKNQRSKFISKMIIDVYMRPVINGRETSPFIQNIYLDSRQNLLFSDRLYYKNFALENWLNKYVFQ